MIVVRKKNYDKRSKLIYSVRKDRMRGISLQNADTRGEAIAIF